jgi:uncharacterized protein
MRDASVTALDLDRGTLKSVPARAGIGLRGPLVAEFISARPPIAWLEVHPENYMGGGPALAVLEELRPDYPMSFHGVGLSLGSVGELDSRHLRRLKSLCDRIEPGLVSEHLSWSIAGGVYLNDLLPLPYTEETLAVVTQNISRMQDALCRRVLIENPSTYLQYRASSIPEAEFLAELPSRTGCGLLCDLNNIYVSCANFGLDPIVYLEALPERAIEEIHLAGHARSERHGHLVLVDDHGSRVCDAVWSFYQTALERFGPVPILIEWDRNIPPLPVLLDEAHSADHIADAIAKRDPDARVA